MPYLKQGTLKCAAHGFVATLLGLRKQISVLGIVRSLNLASDNARKQVYDKSNIFKVAGVFNKEKAGKNIFVRLLVGFGVQSESFWFDQQSSIKRCVLYGSSWSSLYRAI
jgi:hypothetical protein